MKNHAIINEIADRLELPVETVGEIRLTLSGSGRLLAENHGGILEYSGERLVLSAGRFNVSVNGEGLTIAAMKGDALILHGKIHAVELI